MKQFYDKLVLLVAVLALLGGAALYFIKAGNVPEDPGKVRAQPADNPYDPVPVPETPSTEATWPEPEPQSSGPLWVYDVFTPPKIYIDADGNFIADPPVAPQPKPPFGLYLEEIRRNAYRIQIQGYIEEDRSDASKSLVLLFDEERNVPVRLRPGGVSEAADVEVVDFSINRQIDAEKGEVEVTAEATIRDLRTGEELVLTDGERLFETGVTVILRSREDPTIDLELSEAGTEFSTPLGDYILRSINLEENSVTVEKLAPDEDSEAEIRTLTPSNEGAPAPDSTPTQSRNPSTQPTVDPADNPFPF